MWPQYILDQFSRIHITENDNCHFGVYLSILAHECFNDFQTFLIHPQYALPGAQDPRVSRSDYVVTFVVTVKDVPVFFLQVDEPKYRRVVEVDQRMFDRIRCLKNSGLARTPKLHGISAVGKKLAFYSLDVASGSVTPQYTKPPNLGPGYKTHIQTMKERWEMNIMTREGYDRFMAVIEETKKMAFENVLRNDSATEPDPQSSINVSDESAIVWPRYIGAQFARIPQNTTLENHYFGVYLSILVRECFNDPQIFTVHPQYALSSSLNRDFDQELNFDDHVISYVVFTGDIPVFLLDIRPQSELSFQTGRVAANADMQRKRTWLRDKLKFKSNCVSAMGRKLAFYSVEAHSGLLNPPDIFETPLIGEVSDPIPETRWEADIMTSEGRHKFMNVIEDTKYMTLEYLSHAHSQ